MAIGPVRGKSWGGPHWGLSPLGLGQALCVFFLFALKAFCWTSGRVV